MTEMMARGWQNCPHLKGLKAATFWEELDLDRWTWELPRGTPGPYVAEHIPKPLIVDWVKKWKPIINEALEKEEKWDAEYQERDALVKLQKIKAIMTTDGLLPEEKTDQIDDIIDDERELRAEKRLRHSLEMSIIDIMKWHKSQVGNQVDPTDIEELGKMLEDIDISEITVRFWMGAGENK